MRSYLKMIYIDDEDMASQTGLELSLNSDAETWAAFRRYRHHAVDIKRAKFLIDYHNRKGDLGSTIPIDASGFEAITGHAPLSDEDYRKIDADHWREARQAS